MGGPFPTATHRYWGLGTAALKGLVFHLYLGIHIRMHPFDSFSSRAAWGSWSPELERSPEEALPTLPSKALGFPHHNCTSTFRISALQKECWAWWLVQHPGISFPLARLLPRVTFSVPSECWVFYINHNSSKACSLHVGGDLSRRNYSLHKCSFHCSCAQFLGQ